MKKPIIQEKLHQMEQERILLEAKHNKFKTYLWRIVMFLLLLFIVRVMLYFPSHPESYLYLAYIPVFLLCIPNIILGILIRNPFKKLVANMKSTLLESFMTSYHPDIAYSYFPKKRDVKKILNQTHLVPRDVIFLSNYIYYEEDVIEGVMKNIVFYLSEIHLKRKTKKSSKTVFKGLLFKINLQGKSFPPSRILSVREFFGLSLSGFSRNMEHGFWYETKDADRFHKEMESLFPFINHLIVHQDDVRIEIKGNELTLLMKTDINFLDDPRPRLKNTFIKDEYFENIGKQINSLLFIVESLANDLDKMEVEERLELKALEYAKRANLSPEDLD